MVESYFDLLFRTFFSVFLSSSRKYWRSLPPPSSPLKVFSIQLCICLLYEVVCVLYDSDSIHVRVRLHRQFILLLVLYLLKVQCSKLKAQRPNGHYKKRTKQGNNSTFICILIRTTTLAATRSHNNTRLEGAFLDCNTLLITSITSEKKRKCWSPGKRDS